MNASAIAAVVLSLVVLSACGPNVATGPTYGSDDPPVVTLPADGGGPQKCAPCGTPPTTKKEYFNFP